MVKNSLNKNTVKYLRPEQEHSEVPVLPNQEHGEVLPKQEHSEVLPKQRTWRSTH